MNAIAHAWQAMHPPLQCHAQGWLDVADGHELYWEQSGHPLGQPALFLHGGPGAGCSSDDRRWFDPQHYRIVLFDQRGAGRSRPAGRLLANTTEHLLRDIEALRQHLGIDRWLLFAGSWGATLALAYAEQHPRRIHALVLRGVFTATAAERAGLYSAQCARLLADFEAQLHCGDAAREHAAAQSWRRREDDLMADEGPAGTAPSPLRESAAAALATARIGVHYARRGWFLDEGQLLRRAGQLLGVPGVIVQGERDRVTPPAAASALHRAWPGARLQLVAGAGHSSRHPAMAQALVAATDHFISREDKHAHQETRDERCQPAL